MFDAADVGYWAFCDGWCVVLFVVHDVDVGDGVFVVVASRDDSQVVDPFCVGCAWDVDGEVVFEGYAVAREPLFSDCDCEHGWG